jgi:hypothetical protein
LLTTIPKNQPNYRYNRRIAIKRIMSSKRSSEIPPEQYARLRKEVKAPYRGLRKFIYVAFGASGAIGAVVFLAKLLAARDDLGMTFGNLALQVGIVALMAWLFRLESKK